MISPIFTRIGTLKVGRNPPMISPISFYDLWHQVRHEVVSITVKSARADLHLLFHQRFPTGTCGIGNDPVRSCRDEVTSSLDGSLTARIKLRLPASRRSGARNEPYGQDI